MEMEHINENTIRVLIKGEDLAARGFTFLDLLGNKDEIENFFYSILEEVDIEEEFKGSEAVTFQVMPKGDGLELFISKNSTDDLSEAFESFRKERGEGGSWFETDNSTDDLEAEDDEEEDELDELEEFLLKEAAEYTKEDEKKLREKLLENPYSVVFEFLNFELVIWLANEIQLEQVKTRLYMLNHQYYLEVQFLNPDMSKNEIKNIVAHLSEYGRQAQQTAPILIEHGEVIIENDALETIRSYFSV